jgi:hypothetical protein
VPRGRTPDEVGIATKPRLAQAMLSRAIGGGALAWFTADEVYGQAKYLNAWLEDQDVSYVLPIKRNDTLTTIDGKQRADALIVAVLARSWQRLSAGAGRTARASSAGPGCQRTAMRGI